jgi:NTE family protein
MTNHRITDPKDVHYLAFEGGGGKGVAFAGALRALEKLKVLPVPFRREVSTQLLPEDNISQIEGVRGISGASAGAITALFVAMGVTADEIESIIDDGISYKGKTVKLSDFFDKPSPKIKSIEAEKPKFKTLGSPWRVTSFLVLTSLSLSSFSITLPEDKIKSLWGKILILIPKAITSVSLVLISMYSIIINIMKGKKIPLLDKITENSKDYIYSYLFWGGGLFSGENVRTFFDIAIKKIMYEKHGVDFNGTTLTFDQLLSTTGVDLVISGTNVTRAKPMYFSAEKTGDFPVAEAVAISMNIPILFKPIRVKTDKYNGKNNNGDDYNGNWVDGGVINNLPMHAFDHKQEPIAGCPDTNLRYLHPNMLALRLVSPNEKKMRDDNIDNIPLGGGLMSIASAMQYYAEEGQIRSEYERDHTIGINVFNLGLTDFDPPKKDKNQAIDIAEETVLRYFLL